MNITANGLLGRLSQQTRDALDKWGSKPEARSQNTESTHRNELRGIEKLTKEYQNATAFYLNKTTTKINHSIPVPSMDTNTSSSIDLESHIFCMLNTDLFSRTIKKETANTAQHSLFAASLEINDEVRTQMTQNLADIKQDFPFMSKMKPCVLFAASALNALFMMVKISETNYFKDTVILMCIILLQLQQAEETPNDSAQNTLRQSISKSETHSTASVLETGSRTETEGVTIDIEDRRDAENEDNTRRHITNISQIFDHLSDEAWKQLYKDHEHHYLHGAGTIEDLDQPEENKSTEILPDAKTSLYVSPRIVEENPTKYPVQKRHIDSCSAFNTVSKPIVSVFLAAVLIFLAGYTALQNTEESTGSGATGGDNSTTVANNDEGSPYTTLAIFLIFAAPLVALCLAIWECIFGNGYIGTIIGGCSNRFKGGNAAIETQDQEVQVNCPPPEKASITVQTELKPVVLAPNTLAQVSALISGDNETANRLSKQQAKQKRRDLNYLESSFEQPSSSRFAMGGSNTSPTSEQLFNEKTLAPSKKGFTKKHKTSKENPRSEASRSTEMEMGEMSLTPSKKAQKKADKHRATRVKTTEKTLFTNHAKLNTTITATASSNYDADNDSLV